MKRFLLNAIVMFAILVGTNFANAQEKHSVILLDGSNSYAFMRDQGHARRITKDLLGRLPDFQMRDKVTITQIGDYKAENPTIEAQFSKRFPPSKARPALKKLLLSFPDQVRKNGEPKSTNIFGSLEMMARRLNCGAVEGHVYALTDGVETGQKFKLPSTPIFKDCASFTMLGVMGRTPAETQKLGTFWTDYCKAAGFRRCDWLS